MPTFTDDQLNQTESELMERLRSVFGGKTWILAGEVIQGIGRSVVTARKLGATDGIAIANRSGVGDIPDDVRYILSNDSKVGDDATMVQRIHDNNRELHNLPDWVIAEIDEWDPQQVARVIPNFTTDAGLIARRQTFGGRKLAWKELEDKIRIRELWADAAITTAPDRVVALDDIDALLAAHRDLGSRWGTVWAVDNTHGWHGGGTGTHWVATQERGAELAPTLADRHRQVRVQPFLEGVPCSIHGMVLTNDTLVFRPCEMLMLLDQANHKFVYCRAATFWDPTTEDREAMRTMARSIGDAMRSLVDFRGVFTVDGVLTADGFRPTEVNPRFGAALPQRVPTADGDELPMYFTHLAAVEGFLDDFDAERLEALVLARLDGNRSGGSFMFTSDPPPNGEVKLTVLGDVTPAGVANLRIADSDEPHGTAVVDAVWDANTTGGLIIATFTKDMPVGPAVAPMIADMRDLLNDHLDLGLPVARPAFDS